MNIFLNAFWAETLKARRSKIIYLTFAGLVILPLFAGLAMLILKNPEQFRALGVISTKAQITAGVADWQTFLGMLLAGTAIGGAVIFAFITAWVFGREFSDHTTKELLALPTPRWVIVAAKLVLIALWILGLVLMIFFVGLAIGNAVEIPGWSAGLQWNSFWSLLGIALLTFMLLPFVAWFASSGRGYLPPIGWTFATLVFGNIVSVLGRGDWFPWSIPAVLSGMGNSAAGQIGLHSYILILATFLAGLALTFWWWQSADQTK